MTALAQRATRKVRHRSTSGSIAIALSIVTLLFNIEVALAQPTRLTDPGGAIGDEFGRAVAIDGDYAVVGAHRNGTLGSDVGKALVFHQSPTGWVLQDALYPPSYSDNARFGRSVAIDGDFILVGAPGMTDGSGGNAKVHVFARNGTTWPHQATMTVQAGDSTDRFGHSVALDGTNALIGAPHDSLSGTDWGAAYVFERTLNSWNQVARLQAGNGGAYWRFGHSVAISGHRLIVGRLQTSLAQGGAYTFRYLLGSWTQEQQFTLPDITGPSSFGASVAIWDFGLVIGAPTHPHSPATGAAYLYNQSTSNGVWHVEYEVHPPDLASPDDRFGRAVAIDRQEFVVGAPLADGTIPASGVMHVYRNVTTGQVVHVSEPRSSVPKRLELFGTSVDTSDGCRIVGAPDYIYPGAGPGAAYISCGPALPITQVVFDIVCCVQPPDFTTGPVEGVVTIENLQAAAAAVTYWADLWLPDGSTQSVLAATDAVIDPGTSIQVQPTTEITAADSLGDYALVFYWTDGNGQPSQAVGFSVGPTPGPGLAPMILACLATVLAITMFWLQHRRGRSAQHTHV